MLFVVVALLFAPLGCAGTGSLLPVITAAAQGAQALGSLLGVAEAGSSAYLARHPSVETQAKVSGALGKARKALAKLDQAIAIGKEVERYRSAALEAYAELRELLASLGILDAKAPDGGAESVLAPMPKPFSLPLVEDVEALF